MLVLSEVASLLGKPLAPLIPPFGAGLALRAWMTDPDDLFALSVAGPARR